MKLITWLRVAVCAMVVFWSGIPAPPARAAGAAFSAELIASQEQLQTMLLAHKVVVRSPYYPMLERIRYRIVNTPEVRADMIKRGYTINFVIIRDDAPNAMATAGGVIFVTDSLFAVLKSESELASVLAHETGHVVLNHLQDRGHKSNLLVAGNIVAGLLLKSDGQRNLLLFASLYGYLNFDRQQEYQADHEGASILAAAGYDPWAMNWSFERFAQMLGPQVGFESYVSDHPSFRDRENRVHDYIASMRSAGRYARSEGATGVPIDKVVGAPYLVLYPAGSTLAR